MNNNRLALLIPLVGFLLVIIWVIALFLSYEPEKPTATVTATTRPISAIRDRLQLKMGNIKKIYGKIVVDSKYYDQITVPINNAALMNDKGELISLKSIIEETEETTQSTYSYMPMTKTLVETIDNIDYPIAIDKENNIVLYKERNGNKVLMSTETHKTILQNNIPLTFTLLKRTN